MLSLLHKKAYQEFLTWLNRWQNLLANHDKVQEMTQQFPDLQQWFQQEIMTLTDEELDTTVVSLWRSLHTEIQREFRLLSTDMLFLASSRQASTTESRLKLIGDRITRLIAYCQKILSLAEENSK
ncbi:MAG: heterocyst frequency control protein PatD [Xenococcaceae cyanobacterium MO_207.B15]|nr:heterocyst frequency control protein PatD [Xenococcaceae cyanobacterium MO_207.B15]MDJ0744118.1 heterocyst frequency control protein PatD [Xenococcaceae cyanobacterium MO_167.B27]